jgi:hypothetical protein
MTAPTNGEAGPSIDAGVVASRDQGGAADLAANTNSKARNAFVAEKPTIEATITAHKCDISCGCKSRSMLS